MNEKYVINVNYFWPPLYIFEYKKTYKLYRTELTNVSKDSTINSTDKEEINLIISLGLINPSQLSSKQSL